MRPAPRYLGLDLAWADHNPTGACVLDADGRVLDERLLGDDADVVEWVTTWSKGPAVVAADVPLCVPNRAGARPCDRALASEYGSRRAGPHPANRSIFRRRYGRVRGEDLARALAEHGFGDPWSRRRRVLVEVYPHPGLVEVFDLPERLLYKKGPLADRRRGLRRLRALLTTLEGDAPPLSGPPVTIPRTGTGRELKAIEDRLDARFCAWTALVWAARRERIRLFGVRDRGHIAVPLAHAPNAP